MNRLTFADGIVYLDRNPIDAIITGITVSSKLKCEQQKLDGVSGTTKVPHGWEDADITITMDLLTDDKSNCYKKLEQLERTFKTYDGGAKVFEVQNSHLHARRINEVVFCNLDSRESDSEDVISVTLQFTEYVSVVHRKEIRDAHHIVDASGISTPNPEFEDLLTIDINHSKE